MRYLRQSTSVQLPIGPFLDDTDGVTAEAALTIANTDLQIWKHGAVNYANKNSGGGTHTGNGNYAITLDTTDTNTLGPARLSCKVAGACPVWEDFHVLPANVYDSMFSTDYLQVDLTQVLGGTVPATSQTGVPKVDLAYAGGIAITQTAGRPEVNTTHVSGTVQSAGDIIGDTNDIQARLPTALVSGRMDASVGALAANVITAASIASGAIDADSIATNAITNAKIDVDAIGASELAADAATEIANAVKAAVIEAAGSITIQQALSVMLSALAGVTTTNGSVLKTPDGTATRITATINASKERTAMTLNPSA